MKTSGIAVFSDPEVRANREAFEIISALRRDTLADHFAWQKLCHAGKYLDARLDQILREPSMPDEPLAHSSKGAASWSRSLQKERRAATNGVPQCK